MPFGGGGCRDVACLRVGKTGERGGQNVYVQCVCTQRQLFVHMHIIMENEGCKGGTQNHGGWKVRERRDEK